MKCSYFYHLLWPCLFLTACGTTKTIVETEVPIQENAVPNLAVDTNGTDSIRSSEQLKAYPVGRYQDPNRPEVMHEAHTIYRAETTPHWNLTPNAPTAVPLGPATATADVPNQTTVLTGELEQKIREQTQLLQTTYEQNDRLTQEIHKLEDNTAKTQAILAAKEKLEKEMAEKEAELEKLRQQESAAKRQADERWFIRRWWDGAWNYIQPQSTNERK